MIPMQKRLKNTTGADRNWRGQTIEDGTYWEIPANEERKWASDPDIHASVTAGDLVVNDGTSDLGVSGGLEWLKRLSAQCINAILIMDTSPSDGEVLTYDAALGKWKPAETGSTAVVHLDYFSEKVEGVGMFFDGRTPAGTWIPLNAFAHVLDVGGGYTRTKLPITSIIDAGDDTLVVAGDHTEKFRLDNSLRIVDSTSNDGYYTIKEDSVLNGGNTEIKIDDGVPAPATIDGSIFIGEWTVNAAADGCTRVHITLSIDGNNFDFELGVFKNGTLIDHTVQKCHPTGAGDNLVLSMETIVEATTGDKLSIKFNVPSGTNKEGWIEQAQIILSKI